MAAKNKQMKIAVVAVIIMLLISSIIAAVKSSTSSEPVSVPVPVQVQASKTELPPDAPTEVVEAVGKLEEIKDRIANAENYRENYRSETNNGLTVVGTLMEQMIDVMVAVLKQPLVAEAVSKRIVNKQDADEIAEYIEMLGQEVVKEVEQTPLLKCRKARTLECTEGEEGMARLCTWKEAGGDVPTSNCDAYEVNHMKIREGSRRAAANLYNKVLSVVEKAEERDKMYRIVKNVSIDNMTQYGISTGMSDEDIKSRADNFPEQSKLENIAMAHYKYLGHELKKELGDSVNVRELTEEETPFIEYMRQHGPPSKSIEPPVASISMFKDCEESEEGLVKKISINQWQLDEDMTGLMTSEDGEKIKRIVASNIRFLPGSHYVKVINDEEEKVEFEPGSWNGVFFDCEGRSDVYLKDVNLKYKIKPVKDGHLIIEDAGRMQISEEIQNVGNAGSMQGDAGSMQVSESIQNIEGYRI